MYHDHETHGNQTRETPRPPSRKEDENLQAGLEIKRPRSALHSGDFREKEDARDTLGRRQLRDGSTEDGYPPSPWLSTCPPSNFISTTPPRNFLPFGDYRSTSAPLTTPGWQSGSPVPSISSSLSTSFVLKPPTSPLVQSQSNEDLEMTSPPNSIDIRSPRRYTLHSQSWQSSPSLPSSSTFDKALPHLRRDNTFPYQAHQPRRSLTNSTPFSNQSCSPQTPSLLRSRRPSYSENSPLQHASMVGSYEESILRGRMSTTPSRPLDFIAQIGVLGFGKCKSSLRCPPHVTLTFPAVFYSYATTPHGRHSTSTSSPSPYVGAIDLESGLPTPSEPLPETNAKHHHRRPALSTNADLEMGNCAMGATPTETELRKAQKQKRRSKSPKAKAPPGGSYRIPEKGQLQIIIKNPNKTAVKLFLVPYDLSDMEPCTKTFLRQRIYSAGPIISSTLSQSPSKNAQAEKDDNNKPTLRYLIHLPICCPAKGRYYLYKSIRVVFANRVPDGKENLVNEMTFPEPRYSAYKPTRDSVGRAASAGLGAQLAEDKAMRRRSAGVPQQRGFGLNSFPSGSNGGAGFQNRLVEPLPFSFSPRLINLHAPNAPSSIPSGLPQNSESSRPLSQSENHDVLSNNPMTDSWSSIGSSSNGTSSSSTVSYDKLHKGDVGYGGIVGNQKTAQTEGLLARRLKGLDVSKNLPQ